MSTAQLQLSAAAAALRHPSRAIGVRSHFARFDQRVIPFQLTSISMCAKDNRETSLKSSIAVSYKDYIEEPSEPQGFQKSKDHEIVAHKSYAKLHDFCLGIPFGAILFTMGLIGYAFWGSPVSLTYGVAPGFAILALGYISLKAWRNGRSSVPLILSQAVIASVVSWKHFQAYGMTKKVLPWGFYGGLSAAMVCFYVYVLLAGGNPPSKKATTTTYA